MATTPAAPKAPLSPEAEARRQRKVRIQKQVLAILTIVCVVVGYRAWRSVSNVMACEQIFLQVDGEMDRNEWPAALADLDRCLALNPLHYPSYEAKVYILTHVYNDKERARQTLEEALRNLPDHALLRRAAGEYYLKTARDIPRAQSELRTAVALDPSDNTALALLRLADAQVTRQP